MSELRPSPRLVRLLRERRPLLALTGAGVSAESGLATFRGPGGLWERRDPTELATPAAFRDDPLAIWRFYAWRREQAAAAEPNPAHRALVALERARGDVRVVTQNVDGLHERCGSQNVVRLHGTLWRLRCTGDGRELDDRRADLGELVLVIGTSSLVYPAAELPRVARAAGAWVVEVNPETTPLSAAADERFAGPAGEVLPALLESAGLPTGSAV